MNRLWVRLSLMIGGVLFLVFFMQFLAITSDRSRQGFPGQDALVGTPAPGIQAPVAVGDSDGEPDQAEIARRLFDFMILSIVVGLGAGVVIARVISAPVAELAQAAQRVGAGDLSTRVQTRGSKEMVQLASTFNAMAAELQHAETLRNKLMADVSHELRTPLAVLEGNLRAALDHVYALDEAEVANLYSQTRHLIRLVNDLRELALAENHQLPLERQPTDLQGLVAETLQAIEPLAAEKGVHLLDNTTPIPQVDVDPIRIRQVLFNLLTNALRHTPAGGEVSASVGQTSLHHGAGSTHVFITVQDTGEGMEAEELAAVFDRFYRADKSRSRETGGAGLGLAIARAIIEAHGGSLEARSAGKGQGSQFTATLPFGDSAAGKQERAAPGAFVASL